MPSPIDRRVVEEGLRQQGVLTEGLVQWLAGLDMMVADLRDRVAKLERQADPSEEG